MILMLNKNHRRKLSINFNSEEFECPCCGYALVDTELVIVLEKIRSILGIPVRITSGYRCPSHNTKIGGADMSRHILGAAADLTWPGIILNTRPDSIFRKTLGSVTVTWDSKLRGIGWGSSFIHVDTDVSRKQLTQWVYGNGHDRIN